jgi:ATP-dependent Clp protease protease subunit
MDYKGTSLEFVKNISDDNKIVDFLLFGEIGRQVDGNYFAHEIRLFSDVEEIRININSVGGSIIQGNSIIAAMSIARSMGIKVTTINRGVADSMAGMILANGDRGSRIAMDFSTALVHEPLVVNSKTGKLTRIDELEDGDVKEELLMFKKSLLIGLEANTGKSSEELDVIMSNDTRLTATEMEKNGFVDIIEMSNNRPKIKNSMSGIELMAACSDYNNQKPKKMNLVTQLLNLNEDANEASIVAGIKDLQNKSERIDSLESKLKAMSEEAEEKEKEIEELKEEVKEAEQKEVENVVDSAIEAGKYSADARESLIVNASKDISMFKALTDSMKVAKVDVIEMINKGDQGDNDKELRMAQDYRNADMKDGGLVEFRNKVGEDKFLAYEEAYTNKVDQL